MVSQRNGILLRLPISPELRNRLLMPIINLGGFCSRTRLQKDKNDQPEKLLRSRVAQALVKAGLLGKDKLVGREIVYWVKTEA